LDWGPESELKQVEWYILNGGVHGLKSGAKRKKKY